MTFPYGILLTVDITKEPHSVTALVGANAEFYCAGTGSDLYWLVDGEYHYYSSVMMRGIVANVETSMSGVQSNLTVPATLENNGTLIQCVISSASSDTVTITVLPGNNVYRLDKGLRCMYTGFILSRKLMYKCECTVLGCLFSFQDTVNPIKLMLMIHCLRYLE